jgi:hypothetical protein
MSFTTSNHVCKVQPQLPLLSRLSLGAQAYGIVALTRTVTWLRGWYQYFYPSGYEPNATKTYKTRSNLPVRYVILISTSFRAEQNHVKQFKSIEAIELHTDYFPASSFLLTLQT